MTTLATYDVQRSHVELKKQLHARGFYSFIPMNDKSRKLLPNTTVMHSSDDYDTVEAQFDAAVAATSPAPNVEKATFVSFQWRVAAPQQSALLGVRGRGAQQ